MAVGFPAKTNFATGDVLTATNMNDVTGTLNLLQQDLYPAGRNKIINGNFSVNQRAFTTTTTSSSYGFDRWSFVGIDGTTTYSTQPFTPGTAPVTGYESTYFARLVSSGQTLATAVSLLLQKIEDVRTLAGQTATISFWAKAASGTPSVAAEIQQSFGTGGSPSATVNTYVGKTAITTSWARYSFTIAVPSISGQTIGTAGDSRLTLNLWTSAGSNSSSRTGNLGIQSATIDFWGVQVENGSTVSPFQTASGSIAGELALCQRYYQVISAYQMGGNAYSTSAAGFIRHFPVVMRIAPTATYPATLTSAIQVFGTGNATPTAVSTGNSTTQAITVNATGTGAMVTFSLTFWSGLDIALSSEL